LYLSFGCWGQFLEQNLKVSFRHPDEVTESWTIFCYFTGEEGFRPEFHRWRSAASKNVSHTLAVSFCLLQLYILHTSQLQLHSLQMTWLAGHAK
jgi:hypothetical protein